LLAQSPELSVIVPLFKAEQWVEPLVNSIYSGTHTPFELILIHDGCVTALSAAVLHPGGDTMRLTEIKQGVLLQQSGFPRAVNCGLHLRGKTKYLAILNQDIDVPHAWDTRLIEALNANKDVAAVCPLTAGTPTIRHPSAFLPVPADLPTKERTNTAWIDEAVRNASKPPHLVQQDMIPFYCAMFERERFSAVGECSDDFADMKETFGLGEDDEWCHRAKRRGFRVGVVTNVYAWHHWGSCFNAEVRRVMMPKIMPILNEKRRE